MCMLSSRGCGVGKCHCASKQLYPATHDIICEALKLIKASRLRWVVDIGIIIRRLVSKVGLQVASKISTPSHDTGQSYTGFNPWFCQLYSASGYMGKDADYNSCESETMKSFMLSDPLITSSASVLVAGASNGPDEDEDSTLMRLRLFAAYD